MLIIAMCKSNFFFLTVSYLVVFHVFLIMFIWSYWKTIWSKPATPSIAVRQEENELLHKTISILKPPLDSNLFSFCQFALPRAEKELFEREERAEIQQEILKKVARNLPVYTRTAGGGENC